MPKSFKILFSVILMIALSIQTNAQVGQNDWIFNQRSNESNPLDQKYENHVSVNISIAAFKKAMKKEQQDITIPMPDGTFETFEITPVQVVANEVAHLYTIKTFRGIKKNDPHTLIACDISDGGFHAAIYSNEKSFFIEPIDPKKPEKLVVFFNKDRKVEKTKCHFQSHGNHVHEEQPAHRAPTTKRTYRLAVSASGEYGLQFGGSPYSVTNVLNALAAGVNMINPIYLRDLGVEFTLVSTAALVFQNAGSDPYNPSNDSSLLPTCHNLCVNTLGTNGFDVGHLVVWSNTGGLASFGVVCDSGAKGEGFSGSDDSVTTLWVDYVAHELGHQFRSEHNFVGECGGNSAAGFRYEPGEGSSIMSYANVCGGNDQYANQSDPFFHYSSIVQMQNFMNTTSCAATSGGNSSDPVADAKTNITIPKQTPFILVGSATDGNDPTGNLTYDWEQYDGNSPVDSGNPNCNSTTAPLFRYRPPVSDNFRSFPQYSDVLSGNNNNITWEKLPCTARSMKFSMAVRDNNTSFGRVTDDQITVTVANTGPFEVTAPNGGESANGSTTVTWNVNGTNSHCANVDILLSLDGGSTYSVLVNGTPNDGSQTVTLSNSSTTARILVRCDVSGGFQAASTFYDTGNANFTITGGAPPTCSDGIQNQGEAGIDCGGPCTACAPTCSDGIQNQNETGVDCGGPCTACVTCETHTLSITMDNYPEDVSWQVVDSNGAIIASGSNYSNATVTETFCLDPGACYNFTISDAYSDGICCYSGNGSYTVTNASGATVAAGGEYTDSETTQICPASSSNCFVDLTNSNGLSNSEIGTVDYESSTYINTTATTVIQNGAKVDYDATQYIGLNAGFEVKVGAEFDAFIDGCNNGAGGNN